METIAAARNLEVDRVKHFADGRIFTGQQAVELGLVDRLGTEEDARRWTAELAGLDPEKAETVLIEDPKPFLNRIFANQSVTLGNRPTGLMPWISAVISGLGGPVYFSDDRHQDSVDWLSFELKYQGQPLWLYHP